ncbi:helix-turn-helix domain-containing protein [Streptomyces sp. Je 1-4]|uniref:helix-turn-helix domain-containing protein n=1 Tax=Streptomyces TaxID=1883 RepID=UPI0021DB2793|nr:MULTISPECIES: helix-turn-helix transcriptional regulator [unclassified Streptomyces]UYB39484.1 helix-turn-helix domain-containing protein [Streptomyces sp. Je 1-4]UZQ35518.1 helix-turn-helix domain-containing protein [Streptomyces sp. Je 1-4] [Streptomyces sp. Je 1-4 4N24]UZQ42936.1 helix-turn-helix domain-containing protein [Streptomyces sp. Je 1-4] [Streptomyces sp. Je 1-4 4N24_ara]
MTERTGGAAGAESLPDDGGGGAVVNLGDGWESDDGAGRRPEDEAGRGIVTAFGQTMKTLRLRVGMEREEFGKRLGYSASTIAAFEQGRRIPSPRTIDRADEVLGADGLLCVWKEQVERAQYPVFFQGMAALEKKCLELLMYDTHVVNGLLQTEEYMRALLAMRRPPLDQETIEHRVAARLTRQDIFDRRPAPLLGFVMDESVLRHRYGGKDVLRGQLEQLLLIGQKRNVEIQVMPVDCEDNAGVNGPFTVVTRKDSKKFVYAENHATSTLETDPEQAVLAAARYGIIRSQALSPRESLKFIEGVLGSP